LASILQGLNYEAVATYRRTPNHLKLIRNLTDYYIVIDEANDIDKRLWPYLKRIMDAHVPIVLAGLPKVRTYLTSQHPDILSRLKTLILYPIVVEDFILEYKDFESEAIEQIYVATRADMRKFKEICTDCRDKAKELGHSFVDLNLVVDLLTNLHPM
jgi:thymidine kinase